MPRRTSPRVLLAIVTTALAVAVGACGSSGGSGDATAGEATVAPATSAIALEQQAGRLRGGGVDAFKAQLAALKGTPVVVNQWASWCGPCRFEFPFFRSQATKLAGTVAFLGVDSQDSTGDARTFLKDNPVPYPSFEDQDGQIARVFRGGRAFPTTAFYNARGDLTKTHVGAYATEAKLAQDIREYATR